MKQLQMQLSTVRVGDWGWLVIPLPLAKFSKANLLMPMNKSLGINGLVFCSAYNLAWSLLVHTFLLHF